MKAFLVAVSLLCLCAILLCFFAYATGNFPISKTTQTFPVVASTEQSTPVETDPLCSPCVEKMAKILDIMSTKWEADMTAFLEQSVKPVEQEAHGWIWLPNEQREQAQQLIDQYGTEEGLRRLRESDPDAARQLERHPPISPRKQGENKEPAREVPDEVESSTQ